MDRAFLNFVDVDLQWASQHCWEPDYALQRIDVSGYGLWLIRKGAVEVTVSRQTFHLLPGAAFLLPGNIPRDIAAPQGAEWLSVGLVASVFGRIDILATLPAPIVWQPDDAVRETMAAWMGQMVSEWVDVGFPGGGSQIVFRMPRVNLPTRRPRDPLSETISRGLARALFGLLWRELDGDARLRQTPLETPPWLTRTLERVAYEPGIEIHDLADVAGLSPAQFRRSFHTWIGMSPQNYVTRVRLEKARLLLMTTDLIVSAVAEQVGFESLSYFTRLFKQEFGISPARYRHSTRQPVV